MFRKSDYLPPQLHPTYARKPPSEFQMRSQLAHFDDSGRGRAAEQQEREMYAATVTPVEAVPATYATVYAPNDPNADWGGLVDRNSLPRKYITGNPNQTSHLEQSENGIVGIESVKEFAKVSRIDWGHGGSHEEPLIGGAALPDQYKTVYKAQTLGEGTTRDQLSLMKRTQKPVPIQPVDDRKPQRISNHFKENFPDDFGEEPKRYCNPNGTRSMVADLGASLVHCTPDPPPVRRKMKK